LTDVLLNSQLAELVFTDRPVESYIVQYAVPESVELALTVALMKVVGEFGLLATAPPETTHVYV
jgi:hypothetical protein